MADSNNNESTSRKRRLDDESAAAAAAAPAPASAATASTDVSSAAKPAKIGKKEAKCKPTSKKKTDPEVLKLRRLVQQCCSVDDLDTAIKAYDDAISKDIRIEAQTFYNLLNLCDGLSDRGPHIGTPKIPAKPKPTANAEADASAPSNAVDAAAAAIAPIVVVSPSDRREHAFRIKQQMSKLNLPLNEPAYTALIRILCKAKDTEGAEALLSEAENCQQCKPKLRLYSDLILVYCSDGKLANAVKIWDRMLQVNSSTDALNRGSANGGDILPSEKEYCALMQCAVKTHCAAVMERCLSEVAEDVLIPSADTTEAIISWFKSEGATHATEDGNATIDSLLPPRDEDLPCMLPVATNTGTSSGLWEVSPSCSIDTSTGTFTSGCLKDAMLKPVELSSKAWSDMMKMNEAIVLEGQIEGHTSQFQGGRKGPKRMLKMKNAIEKRKHSWEAFKEFLTKRVGPCCVDLIGENSAHEGRRNTFDVVIDGANVGYYKKNFVNSPKHVDYEQIDWAISHFLDQGKSVLMVLHERHFSPYLMPNWAVPIVKSWEDKGVLYKTPVGSNDDWFWLHAALWCGKKCCVLTNDEMRDHHFQMLAHRVFLRWKERSQIHFTFGGEWYDHAKGDKRRPLLMTFPDPYSRRIQRLDENSLVVPLPKRGDSNRFLDGSHDADDSAPIDETYVCITRS